jgi:hypothetical protein
MKWRSKPDEHPMTDRKIGGLAQCGLRALTRNEADLSEEALDKVAGGGSPIVSDPIIGSGGG